MTHASSRGSRVGQLLIVAVLLITLVIGTGMTALGDADDFEIKVSPSVDLPDREVGAGSQQFEVTETGRVDIGNTFTVDVSAPDDTSYRVLIYNGDREIVDSKRGENDTTVEFDTEGYRIGSYSVAVDNRGVIEDLNPLVVAGYQVAVTAPEDAKADSTITISAEVTQIGGEKAIDQVTAVIGNEDEETRTELTQDNGNTYSSNVTLDSLPPGEYKLYVIAQGSKTILGRQEALGLSDATEFVIEEPSTPTEQSTESDDSDATNDDSDSTNENTDSPPSTTASPTVTDTPQSPTASPTATPTSSPTTTPPTTTQTPTRPPTTQPSSESPTPTTAPAAATDAPDQDTPTSTSSRTTANAITPNPSLTTQGGDEPTQTPGQSLGFIPLVIAMILVLFQIVYRYRSKQR